VEEGGKGFLSLLLCHEEKEQKEGGKKTRRTLALGLKNGVRGSRRVSKKAKEGTV